uniref:Uncharacterized protein n=1 Tax=Physcomitrium patens TaxID=3218 RepID=A0A2K1IEJ6_PHYPA|nr:hypothetical protein PHYPA_029851 [Physcomitrium patens]
MNIQNPQKRSRERAWRNHTRWCQKLRACVSCLRTLLTAKP